jgi:hypothetical protein
MRSRLRQLARDVLPFGEILSHARGADKARIKVPYHFVRAWPHLVMAMICFPTNVLRGDRLVGDVSKLLEEGMKVVVQDLAKKPLLSYSMVLPLELLSLMSLRLLQDVTPGVVDISKTYSSALEALVSRGFTLSPTNAANKLMTVMR